MAKSSKGKKQAAAKRAVKEGDKPLSMAERLRARRGKRYNKKKY